MLNNLLINFESLGNMFTNLWNSFGFMKAEWQNWVMILLSFVLFYLAIVKKFEPLLLLPIAFGMFLINLPGAYDVVWGTYQEGVEITSIEELSKYIALENLNNIRLENGVWQYLDSGVWRTLTNDVLQELELAQSWTLNAENDLIYTVALNNLRLDNGVWQWLNNGAWENLSATVWQDDWIDKYNLPATLSFEKNMLVFEAAHTYENVTNRGLLWYLFYGVQNVIYPPLIFLGIGAMTDFGPLISNPKSMLIGAAALLDTPNALAFASI